MKEPDGSGQGWGAVFWQQEGVVPEAKACCAFELAGGVGEAGAEGEAQGSPPGKPLAGYGLVVVQLGVAVLAGGGGAGDEAQGAVGLLEGAVADEVASPAGGELVGKGLGCHLETCLLWHGFLLFMVL